MAFSEGDVHCHIKFEIVNIRPLAGCGGVCL